MSRRIAFASLALCSVLAFAAGCEQQTRTIYETDPTAEAENARLKQQLADAEKEKAGMSKELVAREGDISAARMDAEEWDAVIGTNLSGPFWMTRAIARPMMKARYGRIINMSSAAGRMGNAGQANYAAAKAGLIGLTKTTARELASRGITCNAIAPGLIETDLTADLPAAATEAIKTLTPMGHVGTVDDVAAAAVYLASDEARYVTGQVIGVDGGMVMGT